MEFELLTNSGNVRREAIGTIVQDYLGRIGITVDFQAIEFNTLLDINNSQTFDAIVLGWRAGYPDLPDTVQLFGAAADDPAADGSNSSSFYNERYYELEQQAFALPGCDYEGRAAIYREMQIIMQDEMPYVWLFVRNGHYAARSNVEGFDPRIANLWWNVDNWAVAED